MGKSGTWNVGFGLDITDDHPLRVCGEKQTHDPQPWSRADGAEHFGTTSWFRNINLIPFQ